MYSASSLVTVAALAGSTFAMSSYADAYATPSSYAAPASSQAPVYGGSSSAVVSSSYGSPSSYGAPSSYGVGSSSIVDYFSSSSSYPAPSSIVDYFSSSSSYVSYSVYPTGYSVSYSSYPSGSSSVPGGYPHPGSPSPNPPHWYPGHPGNGPPSGPGNHGNPGSPHGGWDPNPGSGSGCPLVEPGQYCLSDSDAEQAADIFRELIQNYSDELALEALTEDFVDYSSSVNIIINGGDGEPLDIEKPTFVGRQAFMDGQGSQPEIPFKKLQRFHGCDAVSMRWLTRRSANGQETETARIVSCPCSSRSLHKLTKLHQPVVGNVIIETVQSSPGDKYNFRIKTIFSEFNSAAWLVNLGVFVPENGTEGDAGNKRSLPVNLRGPMI